MTTRLKTPLAAIPVLSATVFGLVLVTKIAVAVAQPPSVVFVDEPVLHRAHAHNDYYHPRPLLDALAHGFASVEADIFLHGEQLLVGHSLDELDPERTLERLYLDPLWQRWQAEGERLLPDGSTFFLHIDIKSAAEPTYLRLHTVLESYAPMLCRVEGNQLFPGSVQVVISGNRPIDLLRSQPLRLAGIDGRLTDINSSAPAHLMPLVSDHWGKHFSWQGEGEIPEDQRKRLHQIVRRLHASDRRVRFWATPERPELWEVLYEAGVDFLNTDDLPGMQAFLLKKQPTEAAASRR
jgi:hypothetical protein